MLSVDLTFLWTALNLLILYFFLKKFLFGRVGEFMDRRAKKIEDDLSRADRLQNEGEAFRAEQQQLLGEVSQQRQEILKEAKERAEREYAASISEARREASRILAQASREVANEREQMMQSLRGEVVSLAIAAASKVMEENMDNEKNKKIIHEFLDKEGVA